MAANIVRCRRLPHKALVEQALRRLCLRAAIFPPDAFEKASLLSAALRSRMKQGVLKSGDLTQVEIGEQRYAYGGILLGLLS